MNTFEGASGTLCGDSFLKASKTLRKLPEKEGSFKGDTGNYVVKFRETRQ